MLPSRPHSFGDILHSHHTSLDSSLLDAHFNTLAAAHERVEAVASSSRSGSSDSREEHSDSQSDGSHDTSGPEKSRSKRRRSTPRRTHRQDTDEEGESNHQGRRRLGSSTSPSSVHDQSRTASPSGPSTQPRPIKAARARVSGRGIEGAQSSREGVPLDWRQKGRSQEHSDDGVQSGGDMGMAGGAKLDGQLSAQEKGKGKAVASTRGLRGGPRPDYFIPIPVFDDDTDDDGDRSAAATRPRVRRSPKPSLNAALPPKSPSSTRERASPRKGQAAKSQVRSYQPQAYRARYAPSHTGVRTVTLVSADTLRGHRPQSLDTEFLVRGKPLTALPGPPPAEADLHSLWVGYARRKRIAEERKARVGIGEGRKGKKSRKTKLWVGKVLAYAGVSRTGIA